MSQEVKKRFIYAALVVGLLLVIYSVYNKPKSEVINYDQSKISNSNLTIEPDPSAQNVDKSKSQVVEREQDLSNSADSKKMFSWCEFANLKKKIYLVPTHTLSYSLRRRTETDLFLIMPKIHSHCIQKGAGNFVYVSSEKNDNFPYAPIHDLKVRIDEVTEYKTLGDILAQVKNVARSQKDIKTFEKHFTALSLASGFLLIRYKVMNKRIETKLFQRANAQPIVSDLNLTQWEAWLGKEGVIIDARQIEIQKKFPFKDSRVLNAPHPHLMYQERYMPVRNTLGYYAEFVKSLNLTTTTKILVVDEGASKKTAFNLALALKSKGYQTAILAPSVDFYNQKRRAIYQGATVKFFELVRSGSSQDLLVDVRDRFEKATLNVPSAVLLDSYKIAAEQKKPRRAVVFGLDVYDSRLPSAVQKIKSETPSMDVRVYRGGVEMWDFHRRYSVREISYRNFVRKIRPERPSRERARWSEEAALAFYQQLSKANYAEDQKNVILFAKIRELSRRRADIDFNYEVWERVLEKQSGKNKSQ